MGLLSTFANRAGNGDTESLISDESTTEELTEEETISSTSGSDEGSAESNPPPKKTIVRKTRKQNEGKLWQHNLSARSNQDIQRAYEENVLKEMAVILNRKTFNDTIGRSTRATTRSSTPLGGVWVRLEAEWRDSLSQKDYLMKSKSTMANKVKTRGRF